MVISLSLFHFPPFPFSLITQAGTSKVLRIGYNLTVRRQMSR